MKRSPTQLALQISGFVTLFFASVGLGALLIAYSSAGLIYDYRDTVNLDDLRPVDAIVCLAGAKGRISVASELWYRYYKKFPDRAPKLFLSGVGPQTHWDSISPQLSDDARRVLKVSDLVIENQSANTNENAQFFEQYAKQEHWTRIALVTSSYHMRRSLYVFRRTLGRAFVIETLSLKQEPFTVDRWMTDQGGIRVTVAEFLKWSYFRLFYAPAETP